jgi:hypothetical protein
MPPNNQSAYQGAAPRGFTNQQMREPVRRVQSEFDQRQRNLNQRQGGTPVDRYGMSVNRNQGQIFSRGPSVGDQQLTNTTRQLEQQALQNQRRQATQQAAQDAFAASELQRRENVRDELYGRARGRIDEVRGNELDQSIAAELQRRVEGESQPFDDATRNAMLAQQAEMGDAALQAQMRQMGGRPGDPGADAQRRALELGRARSAQGAARNIDMQRSLANYQAQGQALSQGSNINRARQAEITDAERFLSSLLGQEQFQAGAPSQEISFNDYLRARRMMG